MDWIFSDKEEEAKEEEAAVTSGLGRVRNLYVNRNQAYGGNEQQIHHTEWDEQYLNSAVESLWSPRRTQELTEADARESWGNRKLTKFEINAK